MGTVYLSDIHGRQTDVEDVVDNISSDTVTLGFNGEHIITHSSDTSAMRHVQLVKVCANCDGVVDNTLNYNLIGTEFISDQIGTNIVVDGGVQLKGVEVIGAANTFNPLMLYPGDTLSSDNLTATVQGTKGWVRSVSSFKTGKFYFEVTLDTHSSAPMIGIGNSAIVGDVQAYTDVDNFVFMYVDGNLYPGNVDGYGNPYGMGDTIGVAIDIDNNTVTFVNNNVEGKPYQTSFDQWEGVCVAVSNGGSSGSATFTLNVGATDFVNSVPSGYDDRYYVTPIEYPVNQNYYLTTSDANQLNLSGVVAVKSVNVEALEYDGITVKGLISFDGRETWNRWDGASWVPVDISDLLTFNFDVYGNTMVELGDGFPLTLTDEDSIDFMFGLKSNDSSVTPTIKSIKICYETPGVYRPILDSHEFDIVFLSPTMTKVTKLSTGEETIKISVKV